MPVITIHPNVWTLVGNKPVKIRPKTWAVGVFCGNVAPNDSDEAIGVVHADSWEEFDVLMPLYVRPEVQSNVSVGIITLRDAGSSSVTSSDSGVLSLSLDMGESALM